MFHKLFIAVCLISGCSSIDKPVTSRKYQVVVVLDKTNSVSYTKRLPELQGKLTQDFKKIYDSTTKDIQCAHLIITGDTRIFPEFNRFNMDCPGTDGGGRSVKQKQLIWETAKEKWIYSEVDHVASLIDSPCNSNKTDVFSIFSGIQQIQKINGPWDSIRVYIFSDMINTAAPLNMVTGINIDNAHEKGKKLCQHLISQGQISASNTSNLDLTIYTPDKMDREKEVNLFWKGFFEQWGLPDTHYHFE